MVCVEIGRGEEASEGYNEGLWKEEDTETKASISM